MSFASDVLNTAGNASVGSAGALGTAINPLTPIGAAGGLLNATSSNFQGTGAPIDRPIDPNQVNGAVTTDQQNQARQAAFVNALGAQNGIGNQSQALAQQQALGSQLAANNGAGNEAAVFQQQQALANQLQGVANGTGPNPAQAMLAQQTGNNIAAQGALMASQRGAGANAGLLARQAAIQGANTQQQAVGQGATLQAQQSLGALGQLGNQQQALQGAASNMVNQQAGVQQGTGNLATTQVAQQNAATNALTGAGQTTESNLLNANTAQNNSGVSMQSNLNNVNAGIAQANQAAHAGILGGLIGGVGSLAGMSGGKSAPAAAAKGGEITKQGTVLTPSKGYNDRPAAAYADGGNVADMPAPTPMAPQGGPQSFVGQYLTGSGLTPSAPVSTGQIMDPGTVNTSGADAEKKQGAQMDKMAISAIAAAKGGEIPKRPVVGKVLASKGKMVPGKAKVKGDSPKNDTVPAILSPGEVVIPRSVMNSKDPAGEAAKFVQAIMAKKGLPRG